MGGGSGGGGGGVSIGCFHFLKGVLGQIMVWGRSVGGLKGEKLRSKLGVV